MELIKYVVTICLLISSVFAASQERKVYIAYMGSLSEAENYSPSLHHNEILKKIVDPSFAPQSLVRSYGRTFNGFAAYLSDAEQKKLSGVDGVVSVFPCEKLKLHTTRSWDYMNFPQSAARSPVMESDIIIGVIDTGIWPESESFSDQGYGPVPAKWKGVCHGGDDFTCTKKIIGARAYTIDLSLEVSARDKVGHGSHVASTIAGNEVINANYYGLAQGIARGGVPSARLAVYKVCDNSCDTTNVLSAFDDALADGVDIISISMGNNGDSVEITSDPFAIGAFHAILNGVLTVQSAGNEGPFVGSVRSYAPWVLTVGASDTDRRIVDTLLLGNEAILHGYGINAFPSSDGLSPLVYGKEVTSNCSETDARMCAAGCIDSRLVDQKVVLCDDYRNIEEVKESGGLGCIIPDFSVHNTSSIMPFPVVALSENAINLVKSYKDYSTTEPQVQIMKSEANYTHAPPRVATFSGRGPNTFLPDILKPDIVAPGVEILAAFSPIASPSGKSYDMRSVVYNIISGTSMAAPHVTAAAAYLKSFYPHWSPSALKSALMTTAWEFNGTLYNEKEFAYGAGHVRPVYAINPGLVYETSVEEYLMIWCNISTTPGIMAPTSASCPTKLAAKDINYPSMLAQLDMKQIGYTVSFTRTVTNVGQPNSRYVASLKGDHKKLRVSVKPSTLQFTALNQKMQFLVTIRGKRLRPNTRKSLALVWTDGVHTVRTPIVLYTVGPSSGGVVAETPSNFYTITFVILMILLFL